MTENVWGQKIREIRRQKRMSLKELAYRIDKTPSFLSQIERGLADPSITSLRKIADALAVPIFYFLMEEEGVSPLVRKAERKKIKFPGYKVTFELLTPDTNRQMEMIQFRLDQGASTSDEPLGHQGEECTLVLKGKMSLLIGEVEYHLLAGDSIYYYASVPHKITNVGEEELIFISAITPPSF